MRGKGSERRGGRRSGIDRRSKRRGGKRRRRGRGLGLGGRESRKESACRGGEMRRKRSCDWRQI